MQVHDHLHALRIPFHIPLPGGKRLPRHVWVYLFDAGPRLCLIDTGTAHTFHHLRDYLQQIGRQPEQIDLCLLTHAHPDHIGGARTIQHATGCRFAAHPLDQPWIEDIDQQHRARPVPGFHDLIEGSVPIDTPLHDGQALALAPHLTLQALHTPGHAPGHLAFHHLEGRTLLTGDALPRPGDLPMYTDLPAMLATLRRLQQLGPLDLLLSSLDDQPHRGPAAAAARIDQARAHLHHLHDLVAASLHRHPDLDLPARTTAVIAQLGLPPFAANPLTMQTVRAHLQLLEADIPLDTEAAR